MKVSRLRIRHHITYLVMACTVGGLLFATMLTFSFRLIDQRSRKLNEESQALLELQFLSENVASWLLMVDTLFVESEAATGLLTDSVLQRGDELLKHSERLTTAPLLRNERDRYQDLVTSIELIRDDLKPLGDGSVHLNSPEGRRMHASVDQAAAKMPSHFEELEKRVEAKHALESAAILKDQARILNMGWVGGLVSLLGVLLVWRWTIVKLVRPLQSLTQSAKSALKEGGLLIVDHQGPREVQQLSKSLDTLVTTLGLARDSVHSRAVETEAVLKSIPAVMIGLDPAGKVTLWNAAATRSFGLIPKQALGRQFKDVPIPWSNTETLQQLQGAFEARSAEHMPEIPFNDTTGSNRLLSITTTPVTYDSRAVGLLILGTDITEQRSLEAKVRHSQKLESVGQLAAGIAHEINTPIQYVGHSVHFLQEAFEDMNTLLMSYKELKDCVRDVETAGGAVSKIEECEEEADLELLEEEVPGAIDRAIEGVNRVANIVGAMKRFAHPGASEFSPSDINEAVRTTLTVANNEFRYVANVKQHLGSIPHVECDLGDINQVLLNLIVNAAHAIEDKVAGTEEKGTITIRTRAHDDSISLEVSDTGSGIDSEIADSIFDPFFTTKEVGRGTGQGLAIAHNIIREKHGGKLSFNSQPGKGTTFRVELPVRRNIAA